MASSFTSPAGLRPSTEETHEGWRKGITASRARDTPPQDVSYLSLRRRMDGHPRLCVICASVFRDQPRANGQLFVGLTIALKSLRLLSSLGAAQIRAGHSLFVVDEFLVVIGSMRPLAVGRWGRVVRKALEV